MPYRTHEKVISMQLEKDHFQLIYERPDGSYKAYVFIEKDKNWNHVDVEYINVGNGDVIKRMYGVRK